MPGMFYVLVATNALLATKWEKHVHAARESSDTPANYLADYLSLIQPLQMSIDRLMLFQKQERSNRMRSQSHKTRHPAPEHPPNAFMLYSPAQQPQQTLRLFRTHDSRLDHIHRAAHGRSHKACEQGCGEMRRQIILERCAREQDTLEPIIACELACRHEHGSHAIRPYAPP